MKSGKNIHYFAGNVIAILNMDNADVPDNCAGKEPLMKERKERTDDRVGNMHPEGSRDSGSGSKIVPEKLGAPPAADTQLFDRQIW